MTSLDDVEMTVSGNTRYSLNVGKECVIVGAVVFSVVLNVALIATVGVLGRDKATHHHSSCKSAACIETAAAVANSLNTSHPACSDFYEYSCGDYKLHHDTEEGSYSYTVWTDLLETYSKRMKNSIESADRSTKYGMEVNALFASCMDLVAINASDSQPVLDLLNKGDSLQWPTLAGGSWDRKNYTLATWLATLHSLNINSLFTLTKGPNPLKPGDVALKVFPSGLNMYRWDYVSTSDYAKKRRDEYQSSMIDLVMKLGVTGLNKSDVTRDVRDVFDFEVELAKITPDWRRDIYTAKQLRVRGLYNDRLPLAGFNWESYVKVLYPTDNLPDSLSLVFIEDETYFQNLSALIAVTPPRTLANYMSQSLVYNFADHLPEHISGQISAHKNYNYEKSPLYYQCASVSEKLMPWASVRTLLDANLLADKTPAISVFESLKSTLESAIDAVSGTLSPEFTTRLKNRAYYLREKLGYPSWLLEPKKVDEYYNKMGFSLDAKEYFGNVMAMSKFRKTNVLLSTEEQYTDGEGWDTFYGDNEASYYLHGNQIYIPNWYLFAPVYSHEMPDSFNYGGMGTWVAYYMIYALEDDYRQYYDDKGQILPLNISKADGKAYQEIKNCNNFIANKTYLPPGADKPLPIGFGNGMGIETLHFDIISANIAYKAWKSNKKGSQLAPALPPDADKTFFLAVSQFYCSTRYSPSSYYHKLLNGIAASRVEFTSAFGCRSTDPLYNDGATVCYL